MIKKITVCLALFFVPYIMFAQQNAGGLRDYVGVIHQSYHPDVVSYMNTLKEFAKKRGRNDVVKAIEAFLKGGFGSGFVYVDKTGNNYIVTNYHVITKAHSLSIEFESAEGKKTTYSGLLVLAADETIDIALLAFPSGEAPFKNGLSFAAGAAAEGESVYAAGFPGLGNNPIWQFSQGIVSNARVVIPPDEDGDREYGPWIQHTAQIDAGNSGGPLLAARQGVPTGYAVLGVNNASGIDRQAANYAIPIAAVNDFISLSQATPLTKPVPDAQRKKLEETVARFTQGLSANKAVYPHIARFLSNECVANNAEFAIDEVIDRANSQVQNYIFDQYIFEVIDYSVAWLIEAEFRTINSGGVLRPATGTITANVDGTWTVPLTFPGDKADNAVDTIWINEYGMWRIKSAGAVTGNKAALDKQKKAREQAKKDEEKLRTKYDWELFAGYMYAGLGAGNPRGSLIDAELKIGSNWRSGFQVASDFGKFTLVNVTTGYSHAIPVGKIAITPYGDAGFGMAFHEKEVDAYGGVDSMSGMTLGLNAQLGVMGTTAFIPGLFLKIAYQFNYFDPDALSLHPRKTPLNDFRHGLVVGIGYHF
jgi:serine protease Do